MVQTTTMHPSHLLHRRHLHFRLLLRQDRTIHPIIHRYLLIGLPPGNQLQGERVLQQKDHAFARDIGIVFVYTV
jgi:hypothetical protein